MNKLRLPSLIFWLIAAACVISKAAGVTVKWQGVEVVTDHREQIPIARSIVGIEKNQSGDIAISSLIARCNKLRSRFPRDAIMCRVVDTSYFEKIFVAEIEDKKIDPPGSPSCAESDAVPDHILTLLRRIDADADRRIHDAASSAQEFVNNEGVLDYVDMASHENSRAYSILANKYDGEIVKLLKSCLPERRRIALKLAGFLGSPDQAIERAQVLLTDKDVAVRNQAYRLISNFARYVGHKDGASIIASACENMKKASFLDQNKSLSVVNSLVASDSSFIEDIDGSCVNRLVYIKETTFSEQLAGFARKILSAKAKARER